MRAVLSTVARGCTPGVKAGAAAVAALRVAEEMEEGLVVTLDELKEAVFGQPGVAAVQGAARRQLGQHLAPREAREREPVHEQQGHRWESFGLRQDLPHQHDPLPAEAGKLDFTLHVSSPRPGSAC